MNGNDLLVDTNILIYYFGGQAKAKSLLENKDLFVTSISIVELLGFSGLTSSLEADMRTFLGDCQVIELTPTIRERAIQLKQSIRIKTPDAIIAASALELGLPLATEDTDFDRVPGLTVLRR